MLPSPAGTAVITTCSVLPLAPVNIHPTLSTYSQSLSSQEPVYRSEVLGVTGMSSMELRGNGLDKNHKEKQGGNQIQNE